MTIKKILKILGFIFLPLIPMAVAVYFLFPYINQEKHNKVSEKHEDKVAVGDSTNSVSLEDSVDVETIGEDFATVKERAKVFQQTVQKLRTDIDSMTTANDSLKQELAAKQKKIAELQNGNQPQNQGNAELTSNSTDTTGENFSEKIKSLLDLDVERLTPILSNMDDKQLVRIFKAGSGLQRKKLLRSLKSERAAKLMKEVL